MNATVAASSIGAGRMMPRQKSPTSRRSSSVICLAFTAPRKSAPRDAYHSRAGAGRPAEVASKCARSFSSLAMEDLMQRHQK